MLLHEIKSLTSYNYPNFYPSGAYALWTFRSVLAIHRDVVYHIIFGRICLGRGDYLNIGHGHDPRNNKTIESIGSSDNILYLCPEDLLINSTDIFVEFEASITDKSTCVGFELQVGLLNVTGELI